MIKTFSEVLSDLMGELVARTPFTNLNPSAAIRGLLEVIAKVIADLYGRVIERVILMSNRFTILCSLETPLFSLPPTVDRDSGISRF